jgi:hypothetical protein
MRCGGETILLTISLNKQISAINLFNPIGDNIPSLIKSNTLSEPSDKQYLPGS